MKTVIKISDEESKLLSDFYGEYLGNNIDFNRLMPVVEKIESNRYILDSERPYYITIDGNYCGIFFNRWNDNGKDFNGTKQIVSIKSSSKIESVYKAVVEFIKWYNSQNSNQ